MSTYYFTYGTEGQPYRGGWTEVIADDMAMAEAAFLAYHPKTEHGFLNCSSVYTEEQFMRTTMWKKDNLGARCHERISLKRHINESAKSERSTNHD